MLPYKIAILIIYTESWQPLADITIPNTKEYVAKHGYEVIVQKYPDPYSIDLAYGKLEQISGIFDCNDADIVLSIDLDVLITNHNKKIEHFIEDAYDVYLTSDYNGLNCGAFIIRESGYSEWFI